MRPVPVAARPGHQNLCDLGAFLLAGRQVTDFTARHHANAARTSGIMCCIGTFGEYTVVSEASCIKIEDDIPLDKAALVGCGVTTGWGSAVYAADVQPGETVVVVGCGGVGMNAVQGAAMAGARHVVAVDPVEFKREQAQIFGATHSAASHRGGHRARRRAHLGRDGRQGDPHDGRRPGRVHPAGAGAWSPRAAAASCTAVAPFTVDRRAA